MPPIAPGLCDDMLPAYPPSPSTSICTTLTTENNCRIIVSRDVNNPNGTISLSKEKITLSRLDARVLADTLRAIFELL